MRWWHSDITWHSSLWTHHNEQLLLHLIPYRIAKKVGLAVKWFWIHQHLTRTLITANNYGFTVQGSYGSWGEKLQWAVGVDNSGWRTHSKHLGVEKLLWHGVETLGQVQCRSSAQLHLRNNGSMHFVGGCWVVLPAEARHQSRHLTKDCTQTTTIDWIVGDLGEGGKLRAQPPEALTIDCIQSLNAHTLSLEKEHDCE